MARNKWPSLFLQRRREEKGLGFPRACGTAVALAALFLNAMPVAADEGSVRSFDGLNHFAQFALTHGTTEPPQQGLCVGNGFVLESVSGALAVYDTSGNMIQAPKTLNSFYQYPAPGPARPVVTDPSCYFDAGTKRWFHVVLTIEPTPTGITNHVDIAVSQTADPRGAWSFHKIMAPTNCGGPCLADFPHFGANASGFFVSTNDYNFASTFTPTPVFKAARIYAFSKGALETNTANAPAVPFDTTGMVRGQQAGFTVWPAQSASNRSDDEDEDAHPGIEYFLSSNAADEVNPAKSSHELIVWALSGTNSLDSEHPELKLTTTIVTIGQYTVPPPAHEKQAATLPPLAQCLNDSGCSTLHHLPHYPAVENQSIDTSDTRMQQVVYAGGILYGALGTAVTVGGTPHAGIEWFAVRPRLNKHDLDAHLVRQGYIKKADTDLSFPAIAVNEDGAGAIGFSLMGKDHYPSAAYVRFNVRSGSEPIRIAAEGLGPDDGLTAYPAAFHLPRTRWGDYGAAIADGSTIWLASEYIGQTCTYTQWLGDPTCGGTRSPLANWYTRIIKLGLRD